MTDDPRDRIRRILAAEGQFDADPTFDYKRQRWHKQEEAGDYELDEEAVEWVRERAARANREAFLAVLDKAPDVPPLPGDELP
ncbi:hypothetical protein DAETH_28140 [Deinococcus aetherius]|uniref:Uncharacterized protein n=1 Tax=Deinococcus aetherius TaxID=200252 RepID=A0ABN6RHM6_9DEIO|nr:hypothetical protein [Deinococcus aetherius]BDP42845.1 hypothetical protein DAETH_28140 [Deinococcus aetherius]